MIRCDNGSNFIGAERELTDAIQEMDHEKIKGFMLTQGADWINWRKNPPMASHMGGVSGKGKFVQQDLYFHPY